MSTCLICGGLEPAGTFTSQDGRAHERPFRVVFDGDGDAAGDGDGSDAAFIDVATLEMAQAAACGLPKARILTLETRTDAVP
jgi:hypothetical protein